MMDTSMAVDDAEDPKRSVGARRAMGWDPRSPTRLWIPNQQKKIDSVHSHEGVGCNEFETAALLELLDARDAYLQSVEEEGSKTALGLRSLSNAYRKALATCIYQWEQSLVESEESMEEDNDDSQQQQPIQEQTEQLELLKLSTAVCQLSQAFLLLPAGESQMDANVYDAVSHLAGAVTADTVRYLRAHHMDDPMDDLDQETYTTLESSPQPDQWKGGEPYWKLIEALVVKGCLNEAWAFLSRHSLHQRAMDESLELSDYQALHLAEAREGFVALQCVLCSAPIPGGRDGKSDGTFEETNTEGEESVHEEEMEMLDGIPPAAYKLWESGRKDVDGMTIDFQPQTAFQLHRSWQNFIQSLPVIQKLKRTIPELQKILSVLCGDLKAYEFDSWAGELCAELLYKVPNLRLLDVHVRAAKVMEKYGNSSPHAATFDQVALSIMKGNAGEVVSALHRWGGSNGAALPATITSLLYQLLHDANLLNNPVGEHNIGTELLLNATLAIRSSLVEEGHEYNATRVAVRLLYPHIQVGSDKAITATLVDTLESFYPANDNEANTLIQFCRKLVERKNVMVLDGCVSLCLARNRHVVNDQRPGGAVHWLLQGLELESLVLCQGTKHGIQWRRDLPSAVCYHRLSALCTKHTKDLLTGLLGEAEGVVLMYTSAKEMIVAKEESDIADSVPAMELLEKVVAMAEAYSNRKDDSIIASNIVACLEDRPSDEVDGGITPLASFSMHWGLLRLAKRLIDRSVEQSDTKIYVAAFDVRGMQVLLERLTVLLSAASLVGKMSIPEEECRAIRQALAEGLANAFVADNAAKCPPLPDNEDALAGVCAADLGKYGRRQQEQIVQNMLDF